MYLTGNIFVSTYHGGCLLNLLRWKEVVTVGLVIYESLLTIKGCRGVILL
jgi:hypothetical protein